MHPLLHNEAALACSEVIAALEECHARGFLWKSLGNCNTFKEQVNVCLRAERNRRAAENRTTGTNNRDKWMKVRKELGMD
jgi:COX assembly protein 2